MKPDYVIRTGETLSLSLVVTDGDSSTVADVSAVLKKAASNGTIPSSTSPISLTFTTSELAEPDIGWSFVLTDEQTADLTPGFYITNARLDLVDGSVIKTEPVLIEVKGSVT